MVFLSLDTKNVTTRLNVTSCGFNTEEYPCNLQQTEIFIAPDGLHVLLTISYLLIWDSDDILTIGNGITTDSGHILSLSGGSHPVELKVLSEGNEMWLTFTSDRSYNYGGFSGFVEPVNMTLDGKQPVTSYL